MAAASAIIRFLAHGETGCWRLPTDASSRRYGSPFRPAFFTEIFNN